MPSTGNLMEFTLTNREGVVKAQTGEEFLHPSIHPYSKLLSQQIAAGYVPAPYIEPTVAEIRKSAYGCIPRSLIDEAVLEFLLDGRSEKLEELRKCRMEIKERFPKRSK